MRGIPERRRWGWPRGARDEEERIGSWRCLHSAAIPMAEPSPSPGIGVGTWSWGNQLLWGYDPGQDEQLKACFERALAVGLRFFDTADSYGTGRFNGRSEELLGRFCAALPKKLRDDLAVATKLALFPWRFELRRSLRGRG